MYTRAKWFQEFTWDSLSSCYLGRGYWAVVDIYRGIAREMESTTENNEVAVPSFNKVEFLRSLSRKKLLVSSEKTEEDPHFPRWAVVATVAEDLVSDEHGEFFFI